MTSEIGDFLDYLTYERNVSPNTVTAYRNDLDLTGAARNIESDRLGMTMEFNIHRRIADT